jgi:hypothetical protein
MKEGGDDGESAKIKAGSTTIARKMANYFIAPDENIISRQAALLNCRCPVLQGWPA